MTEGLGCDRRPCPARLWLLGRTGRSAAPEAQAQASGPSPRPQPQSPITGACKVSDPAYHRSLWTGSGGLRSPEAEPASPPVRHIA